MRTLHAYDGYRQGRRVVCRRGKTPPSKTRNFVRCLFNGGMIHVSNLCQRSLREYIRLPGGEDKMNILFILE